MNAKEIVTDPNLVKFWENVIRQGTHLQPPSRFNSECWERRLSITWEYVFTDKTLRDIGEEYGISYEYVRKTAHRTTLQTWKNCTKYLKESFPKSRLEVRKVAAAA